MIPRIRPVEDPTPDQASVLAKAPVRPDGTVRDIFLTLAWHPELLARFNAFAGTFFRFGRLTPYEREILVLRVAGLTRCRYELAQHVSIAREVGVSDATMRAVIEHDGQLTEAERLLVACADAVIESGAIEEPLWRDLAAAYDEAQLLEILSVVGFYRYAADLMNIVRIQPEDT